MRRPQLTTGVFPDQRSAAAAIEALVDAGFRRGEIGILCSEHAGVQHCRGCTQTSRESISAPLCVTGLLVAPGVALLAAGPLVRSLAAVASGATIGAVGALGLLGIPQHSARRMSEQLVSGGILLAVEVLGATRRLLTERMLRTHRAVSLARAVA